MLRCSVNGDPNYQLIQIEYKTQLFSLIMMNAERTYGVVSAIGTAA